VYGNGFGRVTFVSDERRGGLLGQGSLLTVTSYPNRTSPVLRGKFLLDNILGTPAPPPPPDVPPLPDRGEGNKVVSVRERLEQHRVITFMVGREFSSRAYPQIGVAEAHHPLSHHQNDAEKIALLARINTYHTTLLASYLEKLRSTPDGDGSLLDHLLLLYGSGISDSNRHDPDNLPLLLVGGSDQVKGGRHLRYTSTPAANLLVTILDKLAVPAEKIANSGGTLKLETLSGL
jgi:hypothetical protein